MLVSLARLCVVKEVASFRGGSSAALGQLMGVKELALEYTQSIDQQEDSGFLDVKQYNIM